MRREVMILGKFRGDHELILALQINSQRAFERVPCDDIDAVSERGSLVSAFFSYMNIPLQLNVRTG
jgi:hypothetical protein